MRSERREGLQWSSVYWCLRQAGAAKCGRVTRVKREQGGQNWMGSPSHETCSKDCPPPQRSATACSTAQHSAARTRTPTAPWPCPLSACSSPCPASQSRSSCPAAPRWAAAQAGQGGGGAGGSVAWMEAGCAELHITGAANGPCRALPSLHDHHLPPSGPDPAPRHACAHGSPPSPCNPHTPGSASPRRSGWRCSS